MITRRQLITSTPGLVRYATLAPSSHNTQCWQFALAADGRAITVLLAPLRN